MANEVGKSRNEAILGNMLGADNEVLEPFSRIEVLLLQLSDQIGEMEPSDPITTDDVDEIIDSIEEE